MNVSYSKEGDPQWCPNDADTAVVWDGEFDILETTRALSP